jgi:hypothetical protein
LHCLAHNVAPVHMGCRWFLSSLGGIGLKELEGII